MFRVADLTSRPSVLPVSRDGGLDPVIHEPLGRQADRLRLRDLLLQLDQDDVVTAVFLVA
jgi:hypothetical protein